MFGKLITNSGDDKKLKYRRFSIFLLSLSILVWTMSIYLSEMKIGDYGLIHGLHPLFFVSVFILTISFFITIRHCIENKVLLILHLFCMILFFSAIPVLIERVPRFTYNYLTCYHTDYILQYGHSNHYLLPYQSWPGIFYFASIITQVTGLSFTELLMFVPIILVIVGLPLSFLLYSTLLNTKKEIWTVFLIGGVVFWGTSILFVPGVLGSIMMIYVITILLRFELLKTRISAGIKAIILIFFITCVISHFLTTIFLLTTLIFFYTLRFVFKRRFVGFSHIVMLVIIMLTWQIFVVGPYAIRIISDTFMNVFNFGLIISEVSQMGFGGSEAHTIVVYIRIISALMLLSLAVAGFLYEVVKRRKITFKIALLPTWILASSSIALIHSYSGEIFGRVFASSAPSLKILAAKNITSKILSVILLIFLLTYPILSIINAYGNETLDYVSPAEIRGVEFFSDNQPINAEIATLRERIWRFRYSDNITRVALDPELFNWNKVSDESYVLIGESDISDYIFILGYIDVEKLKNIDKSQFHNKIYASKEFDIYKANL